jgi:hypothetical protein
VAGGNVLFVVLRDDIMLGCVLSDTHQARRLHAGVLLLLLAAFMYVCASCRSHMHGTLHTTM